MWLWTLYSIVRLITAGILTFHRALINSIFGVLYSYFLAGDSWFSKNVFKCTLWDAYFFQKMSLGFHPEKPCHKPCIACTMHPLSNVMVNCLVLDQIFPTNTCVIWFSYDCFKITQLKLGQLGYLKHHLGHLFALIYEPHKKWPWKSVIIQLTGTVKGKLCEKINWAGVCTEMTLVCMI